jgi:hypothetical protein
MAAEGPEDADGFGTTGMPLGNPAAVLPLGPGLVAPVRAPRAMTIVVTTALTATVTMTT